MNFRRDTSHTQHLVKKNEKYVRKGCACYWKFSSTKNMKEEFNLHQKHYNSVWGLSEIIVGVSSSVCLSVALPGPGAPSDIDGRDGERKTSLVHPVTSYSAVHQDWCGTHFLFQQTCWENEGGEVEGRKEWFYSAWWDSVTQEASRSISSHSCIMISEKSGL